MSDGLDVGAWKEDLAFLRDIILREHPNPFTRVPRRRFEEAVDRVGRRIPVLAKHEVIIEFARLLAMIRDGHSGFSLREVPGFRSFPLHFYLFSDGLFVTAPPPGMGQLLGASVLSVDGRPAEEVYEAVRSVASIDNEMGLKAAAPFLIGIPEVLHALGVTNSLDKSTWEFATSEGQRLSVPVERVTDGMERTDMPGMSGMTSVGTAHVAGTAQAAQAPVPLYLKSPHEAFWLEYLRDQRTIYVQCNSVRDKVDETFEQFYGWVFAFVEEHPVEKMVLDIRNNGGGNNLLNQSLIHRLICCDRVNRPGRLFTIIGRRTFSAAMNLANDLEKHTNTVFVGEPTGSSPNHFGDAREHKLLNSGVAFHVSTLYWQYSVPQDSRPWITPDIPAELSSEDYRAQRDPAMEAILNIEPASVHLRPFADRLHQAIRACGIPETKQ